MWSGASGGLPEGAHAARWYAELAIRPAGITVADPGVARMFDPMVYKRGALTLHALRVAVGDEPFFAMLRSWVAEHQHGTVTTAQFRAHAQTFSTKRLDGLFTAWLDRAALPPLPR